MNENVTNVLKMCGRWFKKVFTRNLGMKIGSLVFAILLWTYVVTSTNPIRTIVLSDVPVNYTGSDQLKENGLTATLPLSEILKVASVEVQTSTSNVSLATADLLSATVDLSGITAEGEYTLPVVASTNANFITILESLPNQIVVNIEESVTKVVPIEVVLTGVKNDSLYYGTPILSQDTIEITGASSNVEVITKATCYVNVSQEEETIIETHNIEFSDAQGVVIPNNLFSGVNSVIVEVPIYSQKVVPLDLARAEETITGVAEGYEVTSVEASVSEVTVIGNLADLEEISAVSIAPISLEEANTTQIVADATLVLPQGVVAIVPELTDLTINISQQQDLKEYLAVDIGIKNLETGLMATVSPSSVDIDVYGATSVLSEFTVDQLKPFVDLAGLDVGTYMLDVKFENEADLDVEIESKEKQVSVTITEQ